MSDDLIHVENSTKTPERRAHPRQSVQSLAYVDLGEGNGGVVLNVSAGGMAVQAIVKPMGDELPRISIQRSQSNRRIEVKGHIAWSNDVRRLVGVRFMDLPEQDRERIEEWMSSEAPQNPTAQKPPPVEGARPGWQRERQGPSEAGLRPLTVAETARVSPLSLQLRATAAQPQGPGAKPWQWLLASIGLTLFSVAGFFLLHGRRPFASSGAPGQNAKTSPSVSKALGRGVIEPASLLTSRPLRDPPARRARVSGSVDVRFKIDAQGVVEDIRVIKGPAVLAEAAVKALGDRKYSPTRVDGVAVETEASETLTFKSN